MDPNKKRRAFWRCPVHDQNLNQLLGCVRHRGESRERDVKELARDLRNFDWVDEAVFRWRYTLSLGVAKRYTRCGMCLPRDGSSCVGFPLEYTDCMAIATHRSGDRTAADYDALPRENGEGEGMK